ncbi:PIN domain-containing protein [Streptomyces sp. NPDC001773]
MIILDTSVLFRTTRRHANAEIIRTIVAAKVDKVAVPWTVMEELAAQKAVAYRDQHAKVQAAIQELRNVTPWPVPRFFGGPELERVREHWRNEFRELVEVLPVSEDVMKQALFREANALEPCKRVPSKSRELKVGARDVTVWLTAVEYARQHEDETVYFVSGNTHDFGPGTPCTYPYPMDQDVKDLEGRWVHYTSLDDVVKHFTETTVPDMAEIASILRSNEDLIANEAWEDKQVQSAMVDPTRNNLMMVTVHPTVELEGEPVGKDGRTVSLGWMLRPRANLEAVDKIDAYRIGDDVWCTATTRWLLDGIAALARMRPSPAVTSWEVRVLLNASNPSSPLYILHTNEPQAASQEEATELKLPGWGERWMTGGVTAFEPGSMADLLQKVTIGLALTSLNNRSKRETE